jgi:hypothetical protein
MKKSDASQGQSASELISARIAELGDWRGETLGVMRKLIKLWQIETSEKSEVLRDSAPEQVRHWASAEKLRQLPHNDQRLSAAAPSFRKSSIASCGR